MRNIIYFFSLCFLSLSTYAHAFEQVQSLLNPRPHGDDYYGWNVSFSGKYGIVGARFLDSPAQNAGAAFIYEKGSNGQYSLARRLVAPDASYHRGFGQSTDIAGDYAVVGDHYGFSYIYKRATTGNWSLHQKLPQYGAKGDRNSTQTIRMNHQYTAISSNWLVIGQYSLSAGAYKSGIAHIYKKEANGHWGYSQKITPSTPISRDYFGFHVSVSGTNMMVRSFAATYVYKLNASGKWVESQKLLIAARNTKPDESNPVKIFGNTALIGQPANASSHDKANVFVYSLNGAGTWELTQQIQQTKPTFGKTLDVSGKYLLIGSSVFTKSVDNAWVLEQKLTALDHTDITIPSAVAIAGDNLFVAKDKFYVSNAYAKLGKVFVFRPDGCVKVFIPDKSFEQALLDKRLIPMGR